MIDSFKGRQCGFLSNFYKSEVAFEGATYPTAEHAYQTAKAYDAKDALRVSSKKTPAAAKKAGGAITCRPDWLDVRVLIMDGILRAKFEAGSDLAERLLGTGDEELVEGNDWGDQFWGVCDGEGKNVLGRLLMEIRADLVRSAEFTITAQGPIDEVEVDLVTPYDAIVAKVVSDSNSPCIHCSAPASSRIGKMCSTCNREALKPYSTAYKGGEVVDAHTYAKLVEVDVEPLEIKRKTDCALLPPAPAPVIEEVFPPFHLQCRVCGGLIEEPAQEDPYTCATCVHLKVGACHWCGVAHDGGPEACQTKRALAPIVPDPRVNRILPEIPDVLPTVVRMMGTYQRGREADPTHKRGQTLSVGSLGKECLRAIWYQWRWAINVKFPNQTLRIFERGNLEEARMIDLLRKANIKVWSTRAECFGVSWIAKGFGVGEPSESWHVFDPRGNPISSHGRDSNAAHNVARAWNEKQIKVSALCGHVSGRLDGIAQGLEEAPKAAHVLEFKTAKNSSFNAIKKKGVETAQPTHFGQCQLYMRLMKIDRCLYLVTNKDNEEIHGERVRLDIHKADALIEKARSIIESQLPPDRIRNDPTFYICKTCDFKDVCHTAAAPDKNCRTCMYSTPVIDSDLAREYPLWICEYGGAKHPIDNVRQSSGCDMHLFLPDLLSPEFTFIRVEDADAADGAPPRWAQYVDRRGGTLFNIVENMDSLPLRRVCPDECTASRSKFTSREFAESRLTSTGPISTSTDYAKLRYNLDEIPF